MHTQPGNVRTKLKKDGTYDRASPAILRASKRFSLPGTRRPYSPPFLALQASRMEEGKGYLPLPTHSLLVRVHASRNPRQNERITAVVGLTVRGSLTAGACVVAEVQRGGRRAAKRYPATPRW